MLLGSNSLTPSESLYLDAFRVLMLFEVIFGHIVALSVPKFADLDFGHASDLLYALVRSLSGFGREAAFQFIFLSGFFSLGMLFDYERQFDLRASIFKRVKRLYPVLIIALGATFILDYTGAFILRWHAYDLNGLDYDLASHWSLSIFATNLLSLQPTLSLTFGSNGPLWTLGYLIQFFVALALIRFASGRDKKSFLTTSTFLAGLSIPFLGWEPAILMMVYLLGGIVRAYHFTPFHRIPFGMAFAFGAALVLTARISPPWFSASLTPIIGIFIVHLASRLPACRSALFESLIKNMSKLSFAAYAMHMPILFILIGYVQFISDSSQPSGGYVTLFIGLSLVAIAIFASIANLISSKVGGVNSRDK